MYTSRLYTHSNMALLQFPVVIHVLYHSNPPYRAKPASIYSYIYVYIHIYLHMYIYIYRYSFLREPHTSRTSFFFASLLCERLFVQLFKFPVANCLGIFLFSFILISYEYFLFLFLFFLSSTSVLFAQSIQ